MIEWKGGVNPAQGQTVNIRRRSGLKGYDLNSRNIDWHHNPNDARNDIVAYETIAPVEREPREPRGPKIEYCFCELSDDSGRCVCQ